MTAAEAAEGVGVKGGKGGEGIGSRGRKKAEGGRHIPGIRIKRRRRR
jgi:hypothetical protein